jgi:hypothetical protein
MAPTVQRLDGLMAQWLNGSKAWQLHGLMAQWLDGSGGSAAPWLHGSMAWLDNSNGLTALMASTLDSSNT